MATTIQKKLEVYRRKKHKEEMTESIKNAVKNVFSWHRNVELERSSGEPTTNEELKSREPLLDVEDAKDNATSEDNAPKSQSAVITKVTYLLYFLLWATLYVIALEYEFGAVYFILSALVFVCLNTRSGPKRRDEPSAYSVFNPNCEAIEGTLDASQFEREIRYGIAGAR